MALFTDSGVVTLDDLLPFEGSLVQVASSHGIDVTTKINLATSMIGDKLMLWLVNVGASDPQWLNRRLLGLSTVVVTTGLRRWLCFDSLSRFYAEAYNVQLNTRFEGKWKEYQEAAKDASEMVFMAGIGIVYKPLPEPALPIVSLVAGNIPEQALFIQTAWTDALGDESALSAVNGIVLNGVSSVTVALPEGVVFPPAAVGWNVYASSTEGDPARQNSTALIEGETWQLPNSGLVTGPVPTNGQTPDYYITLSRPIQRG